MNKQNCEEFVVEMLKIQMEEVDTLENENASLKKELTQLREDMDWFKRHSELVKSATTQNTFISVDCLYKVDNTRLFDLLADGKEMHLI